MVDRPTSYLSSKLEGRVLPEKGGNGVYALEPVKAGELLVVWGGEVLNGEQLGALPRDVQRQSIQVEDDLYLLPAHVGPGDYVNHCCEPNAGMDGQIGLVAMRDIAPGEEVCYDYAMSDGSPYDEFTCKCGRAACRGQITGNDWRIPELWDRYNGYFSPYLQRRIDQLKA